MPGVEAEASLSFAGLSELLGDVLEDAAPSLFAPRRRALEVALLLAEPGAGVPDPLAIGLAVHDVLRVLAAHKELLRRREQAAQPIARSRAERLLDALDRLEENQRVEIQASEAYERWQADRRAGGVPGQKLGMPPRPYTPPAVPEGVINKTDPDSRMMRTQGQPTVQGYDAQAAVTRGQIIVAAEIAVESPDFGHLEPAVRAAVRELGDAGVTPRPETALADAG